MDRSLVLNPTHTALQNGSDKLWAVLQQVSFSDSIRLFPVSSKGRATAIAAVGLEAIPLVVVYYWAVTVAINVLQVPKFGRVPEMSIATVSGKTSVKDDYYKRWCSGR